MLTTPPLLRVGDRNGGRRHAAAPNPLGLPRRIPGEVTLAKAKLDAVIASVPLFESLSKRHLKKIAGLTSTVEYNAGDTVIQEGEPGDSFFVTVSGQAKVVSGGKTLHRLIPGITSARSRCSTGARDRRRWSPRPRCRSSGSPGRPSCAW